MTRPFLFLSLMVLFAFVVPASASATAADVSLYPAGAITLCKQTEIVQIEIAGAADLYGYQIEVSYDDAKVAASGAFDNSWFDTTSNALLVPGWSAECSGGSCRFSVARQYPAGPLSGSGTVATIALQRLAAGDFELTIEDVVLTDIDGFALPTAAPILPLEVTGCGEVVTEPVEDLQLCTSETVAIQINDVADLYGYQIEVSYDPALANATGAFDDSWFDTSTDALFVPGWDAACSGGTCRFAVAKNYPGLPVSGGGTVATITLDRLAAGSFDVTIESVVLTDRDGFPITTFLPAAPLEITGCGDVVLEPADELLICGQTETVHLDINNVSDLYGYQIEVMYNPALVNADANFDNSFVDASTANALIVPGWDADCSGGVCRFAVAKKYPQAPSNGSGTVAAIDLSPAGTGMFDMLISSVVLSDIDGIALPAYTALTPLKVTVAEDCGYADIYGYVTLQGRATPVDAGTVTFKDNAALFPQQTVTFSPIDGSYSVTVPVLLGGSSYRFEAAHLLYLSNALDPVLLSPGDVYTPPTTTLLGGDANNDSFVDILDLGCIGAAYLIGSDCGGQGGTDINADGYTDILDLGITGGNYLRITFQPW